MSLPRALYMHVPFCRARCGYCDFLSEIEDGSRPRARDYVQKLSDCVDELAESGFLRELQTLYIGGGTPSVLGDELAKLLKHTTDAIGHRLKECTFEANPESSSKELFLACAEAGATRVSIGVQSCEDAVLKKIGRLHDAARALDVVALAKETRLRVAADLMAGLPGQTKGSLVKDVDRLVESGATHLSVYALEIHDHTPLGRLFAQGRVDLPSEDETADLLEEASRALFAHGFSRYEVSNYAPKGFESAHNLAYWKSVPYVGLGPSAASMLDVVGYEKLRSVLSSLPSAPRGTKRIRLLTQTSTDEMLALDRLASLVFDVEFLNEREAVAEDLMLSARLAQGIAPACARRALAVFGVAFSRVVEKLGNQGLLELTSEGYVRSTDRGWLMGNLIFEAFWSLAAS